MPSSPLTIHSILRKLALATMLSASICSCSTTIRTVPIERVRSDTTYVTQLQYDSIYISCTSDTDRTHDTITITKTQTEYRYRLLHDTLQTIRVDSVPYEVRVTETRQGRSPPTWVELLGFLFLGTVLFAIGLKIK